MAEAQEPSRDGAKETRDGSGMSLSVLEAWFLREVWPLEAILMQYLRQNWHDQAAAQDLLHDVYVRVYEAAREELPEHPKAFVFTIARNLLISRVRQRNIVPIEAVADLESIGLAIDAPGPEQVTIGRDELRRLEAAIDKLPPQCRKVVLMRRVDGLSRSEIALRLGITENTVSWYLRQAMSILDDVVFGARDNGERP